MNIIIKATQTTLTPAIKEQIELKLAALEPLLRQEDSLHVEVDENSRHHSGFTSRVEVRISPHGYYAEARGNDFYAALDLVIPKIREQLSRRKDKRISLRRRLGSWFKRRG